LLWPVPRFDAQLTTLFGDGAVVDLQYLRQRQVGLFAQRRDGFFIPDQRLSDRYPNRHAVTKVHVIDREWRGGNPSAAVAPRICGFRRAPASSTTMNFITLTSARIPGRN